MSSSNARRARRAELKQLPADMPASVRRIIEKLSAEYEISPRAVLDSMFATYSKSLPGNQCVGCRETIPTVAAGIYAIAEVTGGAVGSICSDCAKRYQADDKFAAHIDGEGYRAAHGAGPDDVGGTA